MHIMADDAALIRPTNASNHNLNPIGKTVGWISKAPSTSNNLDLHRNIGSCTSWRMALR